MLLQQCQTVPVGYGPTHKKQQLALIVRVDVRIGQALDKWSND